MAPNLTIDSSRLSRAIIFDLDGTLIDSQESILNTLSTALKIHGVDPVIPLSTDLIGPPLADILHKVSGITNKEVLKKLALTFVDHYDSGGYQDCVAFDGISDLLGALKASGINLYVATNKRISPTLKILEFFQWTGYFDAVYAIDSPFKGQNRNKVDTIASLIANLSIYKERSIYVGDRMEDIEAAELNGLAGILVGWGYGKFSKANEVYVKVVDSVDELEVKLLNFY